MLAIIGINGMNERLWQRRQSFLATQAAIARKGEAESAIAFLDTQAAIAKKGEALSLRIQQGTAEQ